MHKRTRLYVEVVVLDERFPNSISWKTLLYLLYQHFTMCGGSMLTPDTPRLDMLITSP